MDKVLDKIVANVIGYQANPIKGVALWWKQDEAYVKMDDGSVRFVKFFMVMVFTPYSYAPETYVFNSCMSDDEIGELFGNFEKRMVVLRNIA